MSTQHDRLDPESLVGLQALLEVAPGGFNAEPDIEKRRALLDGLFAAQVEAAGGPDPDVTREDRTVPGLNGDPDVPVRIYRPVGVEGTLPGIFFIHGGGMIIGGIDGEDAVAALYCKTLGAVVVSSGYRKAPEDPHPAQSDDCFAALTWMGRNAQELDYDPERLAIVGASAGGNLALATALHARDDGGPAVRFVLAAYPMLDHTHTTPASQQITEVGVWDRAGNIEAWDWFLGGQEPDKYASPVLETDWSGFPPTFIDVGTEDLFRDEDVRLVADMAAQGVAVEFHLYPGAYHASEVFAAEAELSQRIINNRLGALRRALA